MSDIRHQASIVWRAKWILIILALAFGAVTYYVTSLQPKTYEATATAIVGQSLNSVGVDINSLLASQRLTQSYATLATTRPILEQVIAKEGLSISPDDLKQRISAQAPLNSTIITITAGANDPNRAAAIANDIVDGLVSASPAVQGRESGVQTFIDQEFASTQQDIIAVQQQIDSLAALPSPDASTQQSLQNLRSDLASLRSAYSNLLGYSSESAANGLTVIEPAVPPVDPSGPRVLINTLLAVIAAVLLGLAVIFVRDYLDDTIKRSDQVEEALGSPPLGVVGDIRSQGRRSGRLPTVDDPRSVASESFRSLRTNLEFAHVDEPLRTLLVTSSVAGEGKSTIAANLAVSLAQAGKKVFLLDADLRRPGMHAIFELPNSQGLTTLIRSERFTIADVVQRPGVDDLRVMTSGPLPPNPAEVLRSNKVRTLIDQIAEQSDILIIDSPPLVGLADAAILSTMVDGTLLVVRAGKTRRDALRRAIAALGQVDATLLGVTINRAAGASFEYYYDTTYTSTGVSGVSDPSQTTEQRTT